MCKRNVLTIAAVAVLALAIGQVQAVTVTVPNSGFELIYKPGQTTITGVVSTGGWTQGVGPDCPIDNGTYNFSDGTSGALVLLSKGTETLASQCGQISRLPPIWSGEDIAPLHFGQG